MSRIGKKITSIPAQTEVRIDGNVLVVKGPLGELKRALRPEIAVAINGGEVSVTPQKQTLEAKALWGTFSSHISNMIAGVNKPFQKKLILEGIGFKVEVKADKLVMALGFSHPVEMVIPKGLTVTVEKGIVTVSGIDKEAVGEFVAKVRTLKKPEPYKGKGFRYEGEVIKIKQGKKSA